MCESKGSRKELQAWRVCNSYIQRIPKTGVGNSNQILSNILPAVGRPPSFINPKTQIGTRKGLLESTSDTRYAFWLAYWIRVWVAYEPLFGMSLAVEVELTGRVERKTQSLHPYLVPLMARCSLQWKRVCRLLSIHFKFRRKPPSANRSGWARIRSARCGLDSREIRRRGRGGGGMNKEVVVTTKTIILLNLTRNKRYTNEDMKNELVSAKARVREVVESVLRIDLFELWPKPEFPGRVTRIMLDLCLKEKPSQRPSLRLVE
ncbi:hypothetical protein B0H14DRAFT_3743329 [Mycena olivaceomarginata]|nr:hypothetical protein B0H14DRAFT_3743329 [Mycena olivaceomarginata]